MKVLMLSKAFIVGTYQRQLEILARFPDVELVVVLPPYWREPGVGVVSLEQVHTRNYRLLVRPIALNGRFHLYFWPALGRLLRQENPDVLHIDEESFNLATFQAMRLGMRLNLRCLFFNWANLHRRIPPPFAWLERYNLAHAAHAVAGSHAAAEILLKKGYDGPLSVIPQVGVDAEAFQPTPLPLQANTDDRLPLIGYIGRLVPQKGVLDLLEAAAGLPFRVRLLVVGHGIQETQLHQRAQELGLSERTKFAGWVPSASLPELYRSLDVLVLPSRTWPNWKEQFGRVLIEAMASGIAVVGSDSGEIPHVIGEAGLVFPEGDISALRQQLSRLLQNSALQEELGRRGRQRVLEHYTQERVAQAYRRVYQSML